MVVSPKLRAIATFFLLLCTAVSACAGDITLDNLEIQEDKSLVRIARVEVINTNASREEVQTLFEAKGDDKASVELLLRLSADRVTITGATFAADKGTMSFAPIVVTGVDKGHVAKLSVDGIDIALKNTDGGAGDLKVRAFNIEGTDFGGLLRAVLAGQPYFTDFHSEKIVLDGFELSLPDASVASDAPGGNLIHVSLGGFKATTQYQGPSRDHIPVSSAAEIGNLVIEWPPTSQISRTLADVGYKKLDLSFSGQMRYDPATRDMTLDDYAMSGVDAGRLAIAGKFGNMDPSLFAPGPPESRLPAFFLANVSVLDLHFVNEGLVEKAFAFAAARQGKSAPALRAETAMLVGQMLPLFLGNDPAALPIARAAQDFLRDSRNFTLTLKARGAPVPLASLSAIRDPATFFALVDAQLKSNQ